MQENMFGRNIIITERVSTLRQLGRNALKGKWAKAITAFVIYFLCLEVPVIIFDNLFGYNPGNIISSMTGDGNTLGLNPETYNQLYNSLPKISMLSFVYFLLVIGAFSLGISLYYLASFRGHDVRPKDVFLGFERFGKALGLFLYQTLFISLWSLLFIVPGIIASIRYSQAFFVLADDPEKSIRECMNESKMMMKGNKAKYFILNLSFMGWALLCMIPVNVIARISATITTSEVGIAVTSLIAYLIMCPLYAYIYSTLAGFYEILSGHLIKETAPAPITPEQIDVEAPVEAIEEVIETMEEKVADVKEDDAKDKREEKE